MQLVPARPTSAVLATARVLRDAAALEIPLRVVGQSHAPIVPQRVGNWWLEPYTGRTPLPPRAAQRLERLLAHGVQPKAVVLFHEIPATRPTAPAAPWTRTYARLQLWQAQTLPVLVDRAVTMARAHGPMVGRLALQVGGVMIAVLGVTLTVSLQFAGAALAAAISDPCLVIVLEDGSWLEVDRWYA